MKLIVCGPPHSGKSVFISNLMREMPVDYSIQFNACPDGEDQYSNNANQLEIRIMRQKHSFTDRLVKYYCDVIKMQPDNYITVIDVGGQRSKENEEIFKQADSFIVLSNDEEEKLKWLEFGQSLELDCIASLDSSLEGQDELYDTEPYIQGKIVGLERGKWIKSKIIDSIVPAILEKSDYLNSNKGNIPDLEHNASSITSLPDLPSMYSKLSQYQPITHDYFLALDDDINQSIIIDNLQLAKKLGYAETSKSNEFELQKVSWSSSAVMQVYKAIEHKVSKFKNKDIPNLEIGIHGFKENFMTAAITCACKKLGIKDINIYDAYSRKYHKIQKFKQEKDIQSSVGLNYRVIREGKNTFLNITNTEAFFDESNLDKCQIPKIKDCENLHISGQIPDYLFCSIINSYKAKRIYAFQPGKGYTCVSAKKKKHLGKFLDTVENPFIGKIRILEAIAADYNKISALEELEKRNDTYDTLNNIEDYFNKNGMSQYLNELRKTIHKSKQNSFLEDIKVDITDTFNKKNGKDEVSEDKDTITNYRSYNDDIDIERDE